MSEVHDEAGTGSIEASDAGAGGSGAKADATAGTGQAGDVDATTGEDGAAVTLANAPGPAVAEAGTAEAEVGATGASGTGPLAAPDETVALAGSPDSTDPPVAVPGTDARPAPSRRLLVALGATFAVLLLLVGVLGAGWARTSGELAERQRALAAAKAEQNRLRADLDAVVARRGQLERDLAAAQAQALDPQSRASIEKCVREYAEQEKLLREILQNGIPGPPGDQEWVTITRVSPGGGAPIAVSTSCTEAATHLGG